MAKSQKMTDKKCWKRWGKGEVSITVDGTANWDSRSGHQCAEFSKAKEKTYSAPPLHGIWPEHSTAYSTDPCTAVFTAALLTIAGKGKQLMDG